MTTRRGFIQRSLAVGAGLALSKKLVSRALGGSPATTPALDYTSRHAFDHFDRALNDGNGNSLGNNEQGRLGWSEGWLLAAYVIMYRAHGDTHYLDKLITHFDRILESRDSRRGVTDWRGRSLPSWRTLGGYTCGTLTLNDSRGRPALTLRTASRPVNRVSVAVASGARAETFKLIVTHTSLAAGGDFPTAAPIVDTYDNLTMNPYGDDYAVARINGEFVAINAGPIGPRTIVTARDPRPSPDAAGAPAMTDELKFVPMPFLYAVQVGQLLYPIAQFVRLVRETPQLSNYKKKAEEFLAAIEQAVALHDDEWRQDAATGCGWLAWEKGSPNAFDGCDQPHNQYLSLGRVMILLAAVGSDADVRAKYRDRATRMARTFKSDLQNAGDGYSWTYFWTRGRGFNGWQTRDNVSENQPTMVWPRTGGHQLVEDTSHAQIDVGFADLAHQNQLGVFDERDMRRFADTFMKTILTTADTGEPTTFESIDGAGEKGKYDNAAGGWMVLAGIEPRIFHAMRENFARRQPPPGSPALPLGIAYLNWLSRRPR